jgi:hypothetical protein
MFAVALLAAAAAATTACSATVPAPHVVGPNVGDVIVLADSPALPAVRCAADRYVLGRPRGVKLGAGTPGAIAAAVKNGEPTDLVILPAGAALDRVRDELATPPMQVHIQPGGTTRWVGAVTDKGLRFARFLSSRHGRSLLSSNQCTASANGQTG